MIMKWTRSSEMKYATPMPPAAVGPKPPPALCLWIGYSLAVAPEYSCSRPAAKQDHRRETFQTHQGIVTQWHMGRRATRAPSLGGTWAHGRPIGGPLGAHGAHGKTKVHNTATRYGPA